MHTMKQITFIFTILLLCLSSSAALCTSGEQGLKSSESNSAPALKTVSAKVPSVVVSITPFHALVSGLMEGVGTPTLLVQPGISPHHYSLRPSEVKELHKADIVIWGGPDLESFLSKPLQTLSHAKIIELDKTPGLTLLPTRQSAVWQEAGEHAHADHHHGHDHGHSHGAWDMHFWLDPNNALLMNDYITKILTENDPNHAAIYKKNNAKLKMEIQKLDRSLQKKLKNIQGKPFLVFHDGYQYFEHHYGLNAVGAITLHPELPISLERLNTLNNTIKSSKAICVFSEPQFKPKIVEQLAKETGIKTGVLDPEGLKTHEGAQGYFQLMNNLADSLTTCLSQSSPSH